MMDARLQLRIQRYGWDAAAPYYDAGWHAQLRPAHDRLLHMAGLTAGQQVIETACGTGLVTLRIAEQVGPDGKVFATHLSEAMLDNLRSRLTGPHFSNIELGRMAAERLDVPNGAFDAAICALGLMYTPDPAAAVAELVRVVKPGGTVAATVWGERRNCGWASVFAIVDARVASEVCPNFFATGVQGTLAKLFETAGLEEVSEYRQFALLTFASDNDVVDAVVLGGPVALAAKRFTGDVSKDVRRDLLLSVSSYKGADRSYRIPGEFLTVKGVRP